MKNNCIKNIINFLFSNRKKIKIKNNLINSGYTQRFVKLEDNGAILILASNINNTCNFYKINVFGDNSKKKIQVENKKTDLVINEKNEYDKTVTANTLTFYLENDHLTDEEFGCEFRKAISRIVNSYKFKNQ